MFLCMGAWAQEVGKVYSIVNASHGTAIVENSSMQARVTTVAQDINSADAYSQLWLVENGSSEGTLKLRNASTGNYLVHNTVQDATWSTNSSGSDFYIAAADGDYKYITWETVPEEITGDYWGFAHGTSDGRLVRWKVYADDSWITASEWAFNVSTVTKEDLETAWETVITAAQDELREELTSAETLMTTAGFTVTKGEAVALTVGDGGNLTTNYPAIDGDVLENCIDGQPSTLFHSNWNAGTTGGHYLQVDLGDGVALDAFVLDYTTRASGNNGAPYSITVSGSNDGNSFTPIKELSKDNIVNPLPAVNAKSYTTTIVSDEAYRYLRFTVNSSPNGNGSFGLAEFALTKATWTKPTGDYADRAALLNNLYNAVEVAEKLTSSTNKDELNDAKEFVAFVRNGVTVKEYPFTITTDVAAPACYLIKSARTMNSNNQWGVPSYWKFVSSGDDANCFTIEKYAEDNAAKDIYAYWYFVENEEVGYLEMVPFVNPVAMGYTTVGNGYKKLTNNHSASGFVSTFYSFINETNATWDGYPYALQPLGYTTYVSNHSGYGKMMGFYSELNDGGTRFTLVNAVTPSAKLADLNNTIVRAQACTPGEKVGEYSSEGIEALADVIVAAQAVFADAESTDDDCQEQIDALNAAIEQAVRTVTEGYYRLICVAPKTGNSGDTSYNTLTFNGTANFVTAPEDSKNINQIVKFVSTGEEGKYYIQSPNAGKYLNKITAGNYRSALVDQADACKVEFLPYGDAQYKLHNSESTDSKHCLFAENHPTETVPYACSGWDNGINSASAWYITPATTIEYTLSDIDGEGYASAYLPFDVTLDSDVKAHAVESTNSTHAILAEKEDIPANEGAILIGTPGTHTFNIATASSNWDNNLLEGTTVDTYVAGPAYVLANGDNGVGLYKAKLNKDANGAAEGTTHFKNNANKAYLVVEGGNAPMFSFGRGEGTTAIDQFINTDGELVIYDLAGRRVQKMEKGIYIVNGKKIIK